MGNVAGDPPCVTVRPFRVSPPEAAAADTAAAAALFRGGMADVAAGGEAAGMNAADAARLGAAVRRWAEATATTDLADIPASYALPPPPPAPKEVDGEAVGGALEGGEGEAAPPPLPPPPSSPSPRGYFFLAVDVSSGRVLGCVGGKPPKAAADQPAGAARGEVSSAGGSGGDANGNGGPPSAAPTPDGTGGGASGSAGANSGGGVGNDQDGGGTNSGGGGGGTHPPPPQLSVELVRMAVATDARRQGVGRALVAALHAAVTSDGVGRVHLSTLSTMVSAMHLYAATGYKETSRVPLSQAESGLDVPSSVVHLMWEGTPGGGIEP